MASTQKQEEWSKERIQAEMKDLQNARNLRYLGAIVFAGFGIGGISSGFGPFGSGVFLVIGIVLVIVAIPFLRSGLAKHQQYNELKKRL